MDKEIIIQNLREKLGADKSSVISDQTFNAFGEMWKDRFANDDAITDETWAEPILVLTNYVGQKRHDDAVFAMKYANDHKEDTEKKINEAKKQAIDDYLKEHPESTKNVDKGTNEKPIEEVIKEIMESKLSSLVADDGVIGKLSKQIESMAKEASERARNARISDLRKQLSDHMKGLGASSEAAIEDALNDIEYGEDTSLDDLISSVKAAYEARFKRYFSNGAKPFGGGSGSDTSPDTNDVTSHIEQLKEQAKQQATYRENILKKLQ